MVTAVTYTTLARVRPSQESDGAYDGTSKPWTSTEVTAEITRVAALVAIGFADNSQTVQDNIIQDILKGEIDDLLNYLQSQNKDSNEPNKQPMKTRNMDDYITPFTRHLIEAERGVSYPAIDSINIR